MQRSSTGPLAERDLGQIYERIMDVMRSIQRHALFSGPSKKIFCILRQQETSMKTSSLALCTFAADCFLLFRPLPR